MTIMTEEFRAFPQALEVRTETRTSHIVFKSLFTDHTELDAIYMELIMVSLSKTKINMQKDMSGILTSILIQILVLFSQ